MMMNTGDEMRKKGEKSYFSNLLHNLSDSCTKNISHCQTYQPSSSKDQGQEHKMFFLSSRNKMTENFKKTIHNPKVKEDSQSRATFNKALCFAFELRKERKDISYQIKVSPITPRTFYLLWVFFQLGGQALWQVFESKLIKKVFGRPSTNRMIIVAR